MAAAALETNMLFKAGAEPRGAATGSMRILMIRMYQRLNTTANVLFASALHTGVWSALHALHTKYTPWFRAASYGMRHANYLHCLKF